MKFISVLFCLLIAVGYTTASPLNEVKQISAIRVIPAPNLSLKNPNSKLYENAQNPSLSYSSSSNSYSTASSYESQYELSQEQAPNILQPTSTSSNLHNSRNLLSHSAVTKHRPLNYHHRPNSQWGDWRLKVNTDSLLYGQQQEQAQINYDYNGRSVYTGSPNEYNEPMFVSEFPHPVPPKNGRNEMTVEWEQYKANPWPHINRFLDLAVALHQRSAPRSKSPVAHANHQFNQQAYSQFNFPEKPFYQYKLPSNEARKSTHTTRLPVFMPDIDMPLFDKMNPYFNVPAPQYGVKK